MDPVLRITKKAPRPANRFKLSNRQTAARIPNDEDEIITSFTLLDDVQVRPRYVHYGPDAGQYHETLDEEGPDGAAKLVDKVWKQYATDVIQKIGNPMGTPEKSRQPSYCIMPFDDRRDVTPEQMEDPNLAIFFRVVNLKRVDVAGWEKVFDYLFPCPGYKLPATARQYPSMTFYLDWARLIDSVPESDVIHVRRALKKQFDKLAWAPAAQSDRIWIYKPEGNLVTYPGAKALKVSGPRIVWNPKRKCKPVWIPPAIMEMREEEEEDEEEGQGQGADDEMSE
ncbi:hypothetical protein M378DRAFT_79150 [Amanita muscaria Koide BX008]|uniref:Uncharacterized protein n=1 Tax=Amanita muscaria (strain Koide BX008) TaxID=946122 RepID=A0A0C2SKL2_AMAMK|nr:hypothetical protein M378DRAFT_79150 [Amanita muscaria Koide BX008]